jgi:dCMP deaminase
MRPTWDETVFAVARVMAKRSTCLRLQTAAVICTPDHRIISTGYNGSLPGQEHCDDYVPVDIQGGYTTLGYRGCEVVDNHCIRTVHAEANAILQAAKYGVSLQGTTMYSLHRTCVQCSKAIVQAGIIEVVFAEPYRDDDAESVSATRKLTTAGVIVHNYALD